MFFDKDLRALEALSLFGLTSENKLLTTIEK